MEDVWIFIGALVVVYLIPGPDMILLLETGARRGRWHAFATAFGLAIARAIHVALAAIGLATLFQTAPWTFDVVRLVGTAYLIVLGIKILRSRPSAALAEADLRSRDDIGQPVFVSAQRGFLTNLLNPKALMFCSVLLPQFVEPGNGPLAMQFLILGAILVGVGLAFDVVYAASGATMGRWIARNPALERIQRWIFASLLIGFAFRLALSPRPQ